MVSLGEPLHRARRGCRHPRRPRARRPAPPLRPDRALRASRRPTRPVRTSKPGTAKRKAGRRRRCGHRRRRRRRLGPEEGHRPVRRRLHRRVVGDPGQVRDRRGPSRWPPRSAPGTSAPPAPAMPHDGGARARRDARRAAGLARGRRRRRGLDRRRGRPGAVGRRRRRHAAASPTGPSTRSTPRSATTASATSRPAIAGDAVDLAANLVPAVVAAWLVAIVRPRAAGEVWQAVRRGPPRHRSRSVGIVSAAFGAALGRRPGPDGQRRPATAGRCGRRGQPLPRLSMAMAAWCIALGGLGTVAAFRRAATSGD